MKVNTYLHYNGNCAEAFAFYEKAAGAKITVMMKHEDTPAKDFAGPEWNGKIIHGRIEIGDTTLFGSDSPPEHQKTPQGFSITIGVKDPAEADRIFNALSEGGEISMPMDETFFAHRFGMFTDKFGIPWMVLAEKTP